MYKFTIDTATNFIHVEFDGEISIDEYRRLLTEIVESPDFRQNPSLLIDQTKGSLTVSIEDARSHPAFVRGLQEKLGEPTIAVVVGSDFDFGMNRMFELSGDAILKHTGKVFRDLTEAREWLASGETDRE